MICLIKALTNNLQCPILYTLASAIYINGIDHSINNELLVYFKSQKHRIFVTLLRLNQRLNEEQQQCLALIDNRVFTN